MGTNRFKMLRIFFLTFLLLTAAIYSCEQKRASTSWLKTVDIVIYPINVENSKITARYIKRLTDNNFSQIDTFMAKQGKKYDLILSIPTKTRLGAEINVLPPPAPKPGDSVIDIILWSVHFRYWAWANTPDDRSNLRRARMFVLYHDPAVNGQALPHSYGLNKGLLGYVNAYADQQQQEQNNIVIAHEFLHTVGALDKYGQNGEPVFSTGYANPDQKPLLPQKRAEIMAGRIPVSRSDSRMPKSLKSCVISKLTALEINWLRE